MQTSGVSQDTLTFVILNDETQLPCSVSGMKEPSALIVS
jgi:hypothetical protein